jgi:hypothetical protein
MRGINVPFISLRALREDHRLVTKRGDAESDKPSNTANFAMGLFLHLAHLIFI